MAELELFTIGVYGRTVDEFIASLRGAEVDVLVDVRWRRGVRGATYAWANRARLEAELQANGIAYLHLRDAAPPPEVRAVQEAADKSTGVKRRERKQVSGDFIAAYENQVMKQLDLQEMALQIRNSVTTKPGQPVRACLFCVEASHEACHRSLLAEGISRITGAPVTHL